ncbi:restriction endonuclease subunit S [Brucella gallinifaecis]|uniref:restriction endonuclease subunit S n=1 Tax=Brucella gallinifaecis TaxID=215590 RepID=UPI00235F200D|nr:restriction endonuclease subunit S [Brucella gallinifaecis]
MHTETFLREFAPLFSGSNGIQKLRELVLQLAVRGKLSSSLPFDDDIDQLCSTLPDEIEKQIANGVGIRRKEIEHDTTKPPFRIRNTWRWVRLDQLASYIQRGKSPTYAERGQIKIISQKCIQWSGFTETPCRFLDDDAFRKFGPERVVRTGDLLWNSTGTGTIGRINVFDATPFSKQAFVADSHVTIVRLANCDPRYVWCFLASPDIQRTLESDASGSTNQVELSNTYVRNTWIPLPPVAEQKRIVAKVDELIALCDELEAQQAEETELKHAAAASALHHLTEAKTPEETANRWSLLAPCFGDLFDDLETIKSLKEAVLSLAFDGKMVPQGSCDETAAILLDRIGSRQVRKSKQKPREQPTIGLPRGWTSARFAELGEFGRGRSRHRPRNDPFLYTNGNIPLVQTGDVARADGVIKTFTSCYNEIGLAQSRLWPAGTLCITIAANIADTAILGFDACFPDSVVGFIPDKELEDARFFEYFMRTAKNRLNDFAPSTAQKNINLAILDEVEIPLPPLAEQRRIVAKIDELMVQCDRLEEQVHEDDRLKTALIASLVQALTETISNGGDAVLPASLAEGSPTYVTPEAKSARTTFLAGPENRGALDRPPSVDTKFQEAVLVAVIVNTFFQAGGEPIGNFRLQKAVYFARRKMGEHVRDMAYLKKAAGPYNPSMKYSGGIAIAKQKNWLREARGRFGFGHVPGADIADAGEWIETYRYDTPVRWVVEHFRYKKNEEWETLATVDYAIEHLNALGIEPDAVQILQYIASDPEWRPKIEKLRLTEMSVGTAMLEVQVLFGAEGGDT